jgi:short-subunit dehydrogenase
MFSYAGKTALITGASSGIGEAFAQILAARGMNLVLVARSAEKLRAMAQELSEQHGIRAEVVPADLCHEGAAQEVYRRTQELGVPVDLLVNNAGFGTFGRFDTLALEREHEENMLNVTALVDLTHAFVPAMVERKAGGVINVASIAAFQAVPYQAVYGASKAFVLSFSLALWAEYRKRGVRVVALCPGPTATNFFRVLGSDEVPRLGSMHKPEAVVIAGLHALEQGRPYAVEGRRNAFGAQVTHMTPLALTARVFARVMQPRKQEAKPEFQNHHIRGRTCFQLHATPLICRQF